MRLYAVLIHEARGRGHETGDMSSHRGWTDSLGGKYEGQNSYIVFWRSSREEQK